MRRWPRRMGTCCGARRFGGRLSGILDLERLLARLSLDSAGPRDVRALAASLARLPGLKVAVRNEVGAVAGTDWAAGCA
jgi:hypothetical protein